MSTVARDWYETPLYYDLIFDADTAVEADFLEELHRRHGRSKPKHAHPHRILEPACGSGRLIHEMARRGWETDGFDASPSMLDYAKDRLKKAGLTAHLWSDRLESFSVPGRKKYDLAHCLVSTFKYLLSEADAVSCLTRIANVLRPGGLFVLGLHLTDYRQTRLSHERWVVEKDGLQVVCNTRTWPADRRNRLEPLRNRLRVTFSDGEVYQQETHWQFRTYSAAQLRSLIKAVPSFEIVACHDFHYEPESQRRLDNSHADIVVVLRKATGLA